MKIYAFHLLNDYSGSPKVLRQLAGTWLKQGIDVTLITSGGRKGFLSDIPGARYSYFWYTLASNPLVRLFNLVLSQCLLLLKLFFEVKRRDIIYINTVLPFGAALLGKLKGCRIIYHVHETSMKPAVFKKFLFGIVKLCASDVVFVSNYLKNDIRLENKRCRVIYNAIEDLFLETASAQTSEKKINGNALMICSLKAYKGVFEFLYLARQLPHYHFRLVVNASQPEIERFFLNTVIPVNLEIYPTQTDTHSFYQWADVILNLSRPDGWIETFGLTVIEGMAYGLPAIVPTVGGITELVSEGRNGFHIDSRNMNALCHTLTRLMEDRVLYQKMRTEALSKIRFFNEQKFSEASLALLLHPQLLPDPENIPDFGIKP